MQGNTPYFDSGDYPVLEYPVLTGWFLELERILTAPGRRRPGPGPESRSTGRPRRSIFVDVNVVLLGALLLITIWAQVRTVQPRPWDGMMLAASPLRRRRVLDQLGSAADRADRAGLLAWSRRRPGLAGVLLGLGMAAKLYPLFLLGPLLLLCLRGRRMPDVRRRCSRPS